MSTVLVVNSGSSSFKYQLIDVENRTALASGLVERIGEGAGRVKHRDLTRTDEGDSSWERHTPIPDHTAGFGEMIASFTEHGPSLEDNAPVAVGHRVVHGGRRFFEPTVITDLVKINIEDLSDLAPLHNPAAVQGIDAAQRVFGDVPHVAVFDTAFHRTLSPAAYTYAIDRDLAAKHRIRRYGFHGTSHKYVSEAAARFLDRPLEDLAQIVLHLGNGASITAIDGGRSVETSMGLTPLEGLVMGSRSGDLDPAVLLHLARRAQLSTDELDTLLNKKSGLVGLAGDSDMRDLTARAEGGDSVAREALDVYVHRLRHYIGAYVAQLGRLDVIAFTAGVGENTPVVRSESLAGLELFGIRIDEERNNATSRETRVISADDSAVTVLVVPTDEELEIAIQTLAAVS
ncbi:acetate/propionate family kinase [Labedella endophytica]|uniref:Acetate kinase n=1 Tax=Labedella endophytica TaxID=1523160 RepID=A0A3S1CSJ6_9MICO|nr:acetate kinase [Labedella endophytica]RUR01451.1 acetate kinase [Labedella endophytica]